MLAKMPRHNLKRASKSSVFKISFLVIYLFLSHCSFAENEKGETYSLNEAEPGWMEIRMTGIEKELQEQKMKMSALETIRLKNIENELQAQKSQIAFLEMKQDSDIREIQDDITLLKTSLNDRSNNHPNSMNLVAKDSFSSSKTGRQQMLDSKDAITKSLNRPPTSCEELKQLGHALNGLYLVQGTQKQSSKILTIHCSLSDENKSMEKFIGTVDVKTQIVHFYVQKNDNMMKNGVITFEVEKMNVGGAMNSASGVFTAPVNGIYHFDFSAIKNSSPDYLVIILQVNGIGYGRAHTVSNVVAATVSLTASLRLKVGDQVVLNNQFGGQIFDNQYQHTQFAGWLVDEDLTLM